jgi:hypothetical protein
MKRLHILDEKFSMFNTLVSTTTTTYLDWKIHIWLLDLLYLLSNVMNAVNVIMAFKLMHASITLRLSFTSTTRVGVLNIHAVIR